MGVLDALTPALGLDAAARVDEVFAQLVLARIIDPIGQTGCLRVLEEVGVASAAYRTLKWRLLIHREDAWRQKPVRRMRRTTRAWDEPAWWSTTHTLLSIDPTKVRCRRAVTIFQ